MADDLMAGGNNDIAVKDFEENPPPAASSPSPAGDGAAAAGANAPAAPAAAPAAMESGGAAADLAARATAARNHGVGKLYHAVLGALGGENETSMARDPQTGEMRTTSTPKTPGQQWKTIVAGALTGLAAQSQVHPGPGYLTRSAGAGVGGGMQRQQQTEDRKRAVANEDYGVEQQALVRKATLAHLSAETARLGWQTTREGVELDQKTNEWNMKVGALIRSDPRNQDYGTYGSFQDFLQQYENKIPHFHDRMAQGEIMAVRAPGGGVQVLGISPDFDNQTLRNQKVPVVTGVDANGKLQTKEYEIPSIKGSDYRTLMMNYFKESGEMGYKVWQQKNTQAGENARESERTAAMKDIAAGRLGNAKDQESLKSLDGELNKLRDARGKLENAKDTELSKQSFLQNMGITPAPQGVAPRQHAQNELQNKIKEIERQRDVIRQRVMGTGTGSGAAAAAPAAGGAGAGGKYTPPAGALRAKGADGHEIVVDGGRWVDAVTGKPLQ